MHVDAIRYLLLGVEVQGTFSDADIVTRLPARQTSPSMRQTPTTWRSPPRFWPGASARRRGQAPPAILLHTSRVGVFLDDGKKCDPNRKAWSVRPRCRFFLCSRRTSSLVLRWTGQRRSRFVRSLRSCCMNKWTLCPFCELVCVQLLNLVLRAPEEG